MAHALKRLLARRNSPSSSNNSPSADGPLRDLIKKIADAPRWKAKVGAAAAVVVEMSDCLLWSSHVSARAKVSLSTPPHMSQYKYESPPFTSLVEAARKEAKKLVEGIDASIQSVHKLAALLGDAPPPSRYHACLPRVANECARSFGAR